MFRTTAKKFAVAVAITACLSGAAGAAHADEVDPDYPEATARAAVSFAMPSDVNGSRISWDSHIPCSDGAGGTVVTAHGAYTPTSSQLAYYRVRFVLYRTNGARLELGPYRDVRTNGTIRIPDFSTSHPTTGETFVTAYAYKWNGTMYAMVARESIGCL